ncbi:hypothetical protein D9M70_563390 [compost metagenome]
MMNQNDKQPKAKRGRPATGKALSNADRQSAYRKRQKAQRNENRKDGITWEDAKALMAKIDELTTELEKALERAKIAEAKLAQRNDNYAIKAEKERKGWRVQIKTNSKGRWKNISGEESWETEDDALKCILRLESKHPKSWFRAVECALKPTDPRSCKYRD